VTGSGPRADAVPAFRCATCGFALARPVARLGVATLGFYDDARFPGRCVLALDAHATAFDALDAEVTARLFADAQRASRAIRAAAGAPRINLALFGNVEPHVHVHLVPRHGPWETAPRATPWNHPAPEAPLPAPEAARLIAEIRRRLSAGA
jgi:diadenosine tetraphosphate (Ap4A) HIT family hydrolase